MSISFLIHFFVPFTLFPFFLLFRLLFASCVIKLVLYGCNLYHFAFYIKFSLLQQRKASKKVLKEEEKEAVYTCFSVSLSHSDTQFSPCSKYISACLVSSGRSLSCFMQFSIYFLHHTQFVYVLYMAQVEKKTKKKKKEKKNHCHCVYLNCFPYEKRLSIVEWLKS